MHRVELQRRKAGRREHPHGAAHARRHGMADHYRPVLLHAYVPHTLTPAYNVLLSSAHVPFRSINHTLSSDLPLRRRGAVHYRLDGGRAAAGPGAPLHVRRDGLLLPLVARAERRPQGASARTRQSGHVTAFHFYAFNFN